jgi:hypothetical protein
MAFTSQRARDPREAAGFEVSQEVAAACRVFLCPWLQSQEHFSAGHGDRPRRVKYLVENRPLHCARVAGHLQEGPHADDHDQGTDHAEDRETLSSPRHEPSRHCALHHRTWDQGSGSAV